MILKRVIQPVLQDEHVDSVVVRPEKEAEWMAWLRKEMKQCVTSLLEYALLMLALQDRLGTRAERLVHQ